MQETSLKIIEGIRNLWKDNTQMPIANLQENADTCIPIRDDAKLFLARGRKIVFVINWRG